MNHISRKDSKESISNTSNSKINARPFERKPPARLKLSLMNKKYGSALDKDFGNTEEGNSSALINIEAQDQIDINVQATDYSATFPDKGRANTAMSPYPPM